LLAAASNAARERGRRDTLAATGVAQRTSVAGRVRAAHDRSADTDARHARVAGGARIVVIAAGAVACGGVDAATLRAASIDGTRVAVVTASGAAGGNDLRLALKGERRQAGGLAGRTGRRVLDRVQLVDREGHAPHRRARRHHAAAPVAEIV